MNIRNPKETEMKMIKNVFWGFIVTSVMFLAFGIATVPCSADQEAGMQIDMDRPGMDYRTFDISQPDPKACQIFCMRDTKCKAFSFIKPGQRGGTAKCSLKSGVPTAVRNTCCVSGIRSALPEPIPSPCINCGLPEPIPTPANKGALPEPIP
jgi:hypothetical protein